MRHVPRVALLALAVGLVLADSSVVTLGLPGVLESFDASPQGVSWVLTGYNLTLGLAAVPAALLVRRTSTSTLATAGLVVFAVASLLCAIAPSLGVLIAARCLQGLGGAAVACAALDLLVGATGSRGARDRDLGRGRRPRRRDRPGGRRAADRGAVVGGDLRRPGPAGAAVPRRGGAAGGAGRPADATAARPQRPRWAELAALFFLGAGLTAALFLLVLLLISGWRESPIVAALTVSVMPVAALLASRVRGLGVRARGASGAVLVAAGLRRWGSCPGRSSAGRSCPRSSWASGSACRWRR
jgi:MFS family permease